jgi:hypothetical protein
MNFDGFKKISSDHASTVLQHPKGHEIRIARNSLSTGLRKALDALPMSPKKEAKGGSIDTSAEMEPATDLTGTEARNQSAKNLQMPQKMMKDMQQRPAPADQQSFTPPARPLPNPNVGVGTGQSYKDGGQAEQQPQQPIQDYSQIPIKENKMGGAPMQPDQTSQVKPAPQDPHEPVMMAGGGGPDVPADPQPAAAPADQGPAPASVPQGQVQVGDPRIPDQTVADQTAPAAVALTNDPYGAQAAMQAQVKALQEIKQGQLQQNVQESITAQRAGSMAGTQATQQQQQLQAYHDDMQQSGQERQAMIQDIQSGQIDPDHYINSMSTGKKLMTGIGLMLGGMGSGAGRPDLAFEALQNNINRDIQAQKDNLGSEQSLLSNNLQNTQNLNKAMDMTNMQTQQIFASKFKQIADFGTQAQESAKALQVSGLFDGKIAELQHNMAVQNAMLGPQPGSNPEQDFQRRMQFLRMNGQDKDADALQKLHVPGVGQASIPPPDKVREEMIARQELQNKVGDLQQFAAQNSGSLDPAVINQGSAKAALVQDAYRRANAQGVFREGEKNFVGSIVGSNPTQFFNAYRSGQGYKELGRDNLATLNSLKKGYGLPASAAPAAALSKASGAKSGIRYMGGKPYKLDPTGKFMIPVK